MQSFKRYFRSLFSFSRVKTEEEVKQAKGEVKETEKTNIFIPIISDSDDENENSTSKSSSKFQSVKQEVNSEFHVKQETKIKNENTNSSIVKSPILSETEYKNKAFSSPISQTNKLGNKVDLNVPQKEKSYETIDSDFDIEDDDETDDIEIEEEVNEKEDNTTNLNIKENHQTNNKIEENEKENQKLEKSKNESKQKTKKIINIESDEDSDEENLAAQNNEQNKSKSSDKQQNISQENQQKEEMDDNKELERIYKHFKQDLDSFDLDDDSDDVEFLDQINNFIPREDESDLKKEFDHKLEQTRKIKSFSNCSNLLEPKINERISITKALFNASDETFQSIINDVITFLKTNPSDLGIFVSCIEWFSYVRPSHLQQLNAFEDSLKLQFPNIFDYTIRKYQITFEKDSIETIIINDDFSKLQMKILADSTFDYNKEQIENRKYLYPTKSKFLNLLEIAAFYGSLKCFMFLQNNSTKEYSDYINQLAVAGGDYDIIASLSQNSVKFDNCLHICIKYHRNYLNTFLLSYECEYLPLSRCLFYRNEEAFFFFLFNHVDMNECVSFSEGCNYNPLYSVCKFMNGNYDLLEILINNGAQLTNKSKDIADLSNTLPRSGEFTPLQITCASSYSDLKIVNYLLSNDTSTNRPFLLNCECNKRNPNTDVIELLCNSTSYLDVVFLREFGYVYPFYTACKNPYSTVRIIRIFLDHKANPNKNVYPHSKKTTPFYAACMQSNPNLDIIKTLLKYADQTNLSQIISLLCLKKHPNISLIKLLISSGAKLDIANIVLACMNENPSLELLDLLLKSSTININQYYPLQFACFNPNTNFSFIKTLIDHGADAKLLTPLKDVCKREDIDPNIVKLLITSGANVNKENPLFYACKNENADVEIIKILLENGADINKEFVFPDGTKITPLYAAMNNSKPKIEIVRYLLKSGAINKGY